MSKNIPLALVICCLLSIAGGIWGSFHSTTLILLENPDQALDVGASRGDVPLMKAALARHADPNHRGPYAGRTALMVAAIHNQPGSIRFLLAHKANPELLDQKGFSAVGLASQSGSAEALAAFGPAGMKR